MSDLLIEIGTEELPTKAVLDLSHAFADAFADLLTKNNITFKSKQIFATPRRIGLLIKELADKIPGKTVEHRGPPVNAAPPAIQGFADKFKVGVNDLQKLKNDKGEYYIYCEAQAARETSSVVLTFIEEALAKLPIKKPMSWGEHTFKFVRPVHWAVVLLGDKVLEGKLFNQNIGRETYGHRFLNNTALNIDKPENYEKILKNDGFVLANFNARKDEIAKQITALSAEKNLTPIMDEDLLDEVTSIVEWPVAVVGQFDPEFLKLPKEVISLTLKQNQKCFVLKDNQDKLAPYFITISNIKSNDPKQVISGNEKVVRARLSDAAFFFAQDKKQTLEDRLSAVAQITFQQGLGSVLDKSERIVKISKQIAAQLNVDPELIGRAALLCKADLTSSMVGEFPELQGIMGAYYAKDDIARAIREHYQPSGANDQIPSSLEGAILSMSDKLDTLIGIFSIGKKPTGDKDPFGLRRAAIGVLRIIIEKELFLDLKDYVNDEVSEFILDRLESLLKEQGYPAELFAAVKAIGCTKPYDVYLRVQALQKFIAMPEAASLASAHKRVNNLLKQNKVEQSKIDESKLLSLEEKELVRLLGEKEKQVGDLCQQQAYSNALISLADLKPVLDAFFENVLVIDKEVSIKNNRLAILKKLNDLFTQIADFSYLPVVQ